MSRKEVKKERSLEYVRPEISAEWDYEKNALEPADYTYASNEKVWWICPRGHSYDATINHRTNKKNPRGCPYCSGRKAIIGETDLATLRPDIAIEWDYENNEANPEDFTVNSGKQVHWKCKNGHIYTARIADRTKEKKPTGCPYCTGQKPIVGETDLKSHNPELIKEWDWEKNDKSPEEYSYGSGKKVLWICPKGHSYSAAINHRTANKNPTGCPVCSGRIVSLGENDLLTLRPDIAAEWDYVNNGEKRPEHYTVSAKEKVFWKCEKGHSYSARIYSRTSGRNSTGCPFCDKKKVLVGENDLKTLRPDIAAEWDYDMNKKKPEDYTVSSGSNVYWRCVLGHSYQAKIYNRTKVDKPTGCPFCSGRNPIVGETDLQTVRPELAKEWNYEKNRNLTPQMVTAFAYRKVWWKCSVCGHEWYAVIRNRSNGNGCPRCNRK